MRPGEQMPPQQQHAPLLIPALVFEPQAHFHAGNGGEPLAVVVEQGKSVAFAGAFALKVAEMPGLEDFAAFQNQVHHEQQTPIARVVAPAQKQTEAATPWKQHVVFEGAEIPAPELSCLQKQTRSNKFKFRGNKKKRNVESRLK